MNTVQHSEYTSVAGATGFDRMAARIVFRVHEALPWLLIPSGVPSQIALDPVLAPVPNVKPWLRGVLNLRGNLVPIFDIAATCGLPLAELKTSAVLVLEPGNNPIGLLCVEPPRIAQGSPAAAEELPSHLATLAEFLLPPLRWEEGLGYEFRFREWTSRIGRQLAGVATTTSLT